MGKDKVGYGVAGCGALLAGMAFLSLCFWSFHTFIEPGGAISSDEAAPGVLGSCCCVFISLLIAAGGVFVAMRAKKGAAPDAPPTPMPAAPPSDEMPGPILPLLEGGEREPMSPDVQTAAATFPNGDFETLRARTQQWFAAQGWTLVPNSEVDGEKTAATLREMGMHDAAATALERPSYGASFQRNGVTVAANIDSLGGTLRLSLNWF